MLILASNSPRRKELLKLITPDFTVIPAKIDEAVDSSVPLFSRPQYLAEKKAKYIFTNGHNEDTVIGSDTGVFIDDVMLGKPENADDARRMLKMLSGRCHRVITGCCIISDKGCKTFSQITEVEFYALSDTDINDYILTHEPDDKAGAYGIQGKGAILVKGIYGDYFNVVGLPVSLLNQKLKAFL